MQKLTLLGPYDATEVVIGPPCPVGSARELNQIQHTLPSLIYRGSKDNRPFDTELNENSCRGPGSVESTKQVQIEALGVVA